MKGWLMSYNHGIFCLEGDWKNDFNRTSSVKPVLKLLAQAQNRPIPFVHRDVGTREELEYYCRRWTRKGSAHYPVLYLAFHGAAGGIYVGDRRLKTRSKVTLDDLAEILGPKLNRRVIHLGSCSTMNTSRRHIQQFLQKTGANAISGFKNEVDWLLSSVFEVLLFSELLRHNLTLPGVRRVDESLRREYGALCRKLDFRMVIREPV